MAHVRCRLRVHHCFFSKPEATREYACVYVLGSYKTLCYISHEIIPLYTIRTTGIAAGYSSILMGCLAAEFFSKVPP